MKSLVATVHDGNVNAAARDIEMAQSTLAQIVNGEVRQPRPDVLERIAAFYRATPEWLVSGKGEPPPVIAPTQGNIVPQAEGLRWYRLGERLGGDTDFRNAFSRLPRQMIEAIDHCALKGDASTPAGLRIREAYRTAIAAEYRSWLTLIETWLDNLGAEKTREQLRPILKGKR